MSKELFSFIKGWMQLRQIDTEAVKARIMEALGITTRTSWSNRLNGHIEPKVSEVRAIEAIFADYGITDIWGR